MIQKFLPSGRRRPFILVGTVAFSINILVLSACDTMPALTFVWMLAQFTSNIASASFVGLLPDAVDKTQLGLLAESWEALQHLGS